MDSDPDIVKAAKNKDLNLVMKLVEAGVDVNATYYSNPAALYIAVKNRDLEMVEYLVEHGAYINGPPREHAWVPLFAAIAVSDFEIVQYLVDHGANIDAPGAFGFNAIKVALNLSEKINKNFFSKNLNKDKYDEYVNNLKIIKYLLSKDVKITEKEHSDIGVAIQDLLSKVKKMAIEAKKLYRLYPGVEAMANILRYTHDPDYIFSDEELMVIAEVGFKYPLKFINTYSDENSLKVILYKNWPWLFKYFFPTKFDSFRDLFQYKK